MNELSLQTQDTARLRRQLAQLHLLLLQRSKIGHWVRVAATVGGIGTIFLAVLGTAPADRWQYEASLSLIGAVLVAMIVAEVVTWKLHRTSDAEATTEADHLRVRIDEIASEGAFIDNYRECVMLKASSEVAAEDADEGTRLKSHWIDRVSRRLANHRQTLAANTLTAAERAEVECRVQDLEDALRSAGVNPEDQ